MRRTTAWGLTLLCALFGACSDDDDPETQISTAGASASQTDSPKAGSGGAGGTKANGAAGKKADAPVDIAAFKATGLDKYLGKAKPAMMETSGDETQYFFDEADGPVCLRGGRYGMGVRDTGSEDLVIYLQGGGSCRTSLCRATETANPKLPTTGIFNNTDDENPVKGWNVVYAPYCDGSLHFGDSDIPDMNRKHHGLRNTSAALDVAKDKFPNPRRILLVGVSAGGYGTIWITGLVRVIYPDAELFVFNDAGMAIANPATPDGFRDVLGEWGARQFLPESCEDCKTSPHLAVWQTWNLQRDPSLTLGLFSSCEDSTIADTFLMLDRAVFKQALLDETKKVVDTAPSRAKRFLVSGAQHTVGNIHTTKVGDTSVAQWLKLMLDRDPAWDNLLAD